VNRSFIFAMTSTVPDGLCGRVTRPSGLRTMHGGRPDGLVDIGPARPGRQSTGSVLLASGPVGRPRSEAGR
jgi:hypothetical protein